MVYRFLVLIGVLMFVLLNMGIYNWGVESIWQDGWVGLFLFWLGIGVFCVMVGVAIGDDKIKSIAFTAVLGLVVVVVVGGLLSSDSFTGWLSQIMPDVHWQSPIVVNQPPTECLCITETPEP